MGIDEIEFIQNMQKLEFNDGDLIVLKAKHLLSHQEYKDISMMIENVVEQMGIKNKFIILDGDLDIGILRKEINE